MSLPLMEADKKPLTKEESAKAIEAAIRKSLKKPTGKLTKVDFQRVTELYLTGTKITVTGLTELSVTRII